MGSHPAFAGIRRVPPPVNEPNPGHLPGSPERSAFKTSLSAMAGAHADIPLFIGGREVRTGRTKPVVAPHDRRRLLGVFHTAGPEAVRAAIAAAAEARAAWSGWAWEERAAVFLRAEELLATSWRPTVNAATMLGQSKTVWQAEIDAAAELVDFWRFNPHYAQQLYGEQPFGGGRRSGTNDKAGSMINMARWVSARNVKETFVPPREWLSTHVGGVAWARQ